MAEMSRRAHEDNEMLRNEISALWQHLRRVDPNSHHVYGNMTHVLAQQEQQQGQPAATGSGGHVLPPLSNPPPSAHGHAWPPQTPTQSNAMQGVEFGGSRGLEHR
jgi:hypothetical protein